MTTTQQTPTAWPENVIARYLTVGGATVDLVEQPGYVRVTQPTETRATCIGCGSWEDKDWGFDFFAHENGEPQPASFDAGGRYTNPQLRAWAQAHAETCRAMPKPTN